LSIRFLSIRAFIPTAVLVSAMALTVSPSYSQPQAPGPQSLPAPDTTPGQNPGGIAAPNTAAAPPAKVPDYPDPRTVVFGIYGLYSFTGNGPNILGGKTAADTNTYESLYGIGQPYKFIPGFEAGMPVTRTGMLYVEFDRYHGDANQTLSRDSFIDNYSFLKGDAISSTYHILTGRIYLDDLMYPHKFPVSKFRLKSIWGIRYITLSDTVDSTTRDNAAGAPGSSFQLGTNYIFLPELGAAMEYALAPHVLFRVDGVGFGIPHRSDFAETSATLSYRKNNLEVLMGARMLHFKTTPQKDEYESATFTTPFIGLRWHF
jgi:hypothetical protein